MPMFATPDRRRILAVLLCLSACTEEFVMTETDVAAANKAAVLRLFAEVFNGHRDHVLRELVAPEFVNTFTGVHGPEGMASGAAFLRKTFESPRFVVEDAVAEGDRVAVRWTLHGRHVGAFRGTPPSGDAVEMPSLSLYRMVDRKIAESWVQSGPLRSGGGS